jgi:hypothetical protein
MARHPKTLAEYQKQSKKAAPKKVAKKAPTPTAKAKAKKAIPAKAKAPSKAKKALTPKKKLGGAKAKAAPKKVAKGTADHWFAKLSKAAQLAYIKTHPNSKYAKGVKAKGVSKVGASLTKAADKLKIKNLNAEHRAANRAEIKAAQKHNSAVFKVNAAAEKHASAKTPAAKKKHKLALTAAKDVLKAAKSQHRAAKKHLSEKAKAAKGHLKPIKKARRADGRQPDRTVKLRSVKKPKLGKAVVASKTGGMTSMAKKKTLKPSPKIAKKLQGLSIAQKARLKDLKLHPKKKASKK